MSHGKRYQKALENGDEIKIEENFLIFRIEREMFYASRITFETTEIFH